MDRTTRDENEDLTPQEVAAFAALPRVQRPDAALEDRVVGALRAEGRIRISRFRAPAWIALAGLATAAGVFLLGFTIGRSSMHAAPGLAQEAPRQWLLLLYAGIGYEMALPAQEAARRAEYVSWARELAARGRLVSGEELTATETVLMGGCGDVRVVNASSHSEEGVVRGFFIIRAPTRDKAIEEAKTSPHLKYGGIISLSEIEPGQDGGRSAGKTAARLRTGLSWFAERDSCKEPVGIAAILTRSAAPEGAFSRR